MQSCLYEGRVQHRRFGPVEHQFKYPLFLLYLDLAEVPELARQGFFTCERGWSSRALWPSDHLPLPKLQDSSNTRELTPPIHTGRAPQSPPTNSDFASVDTFIRDHVEHESGQRPVGPIRLLTHLRYFGYFFSPLNLYYCFDASGTEVEAIVAEVNNIPWRERHHYVLHHGNRSARGLAFRHEKAFHVSPFMPMEQQYRWHFRAPGDQLTVHLSNWPSELRPATDSSDENLKTTDISREKRPVSPLFDATLLMRRSELTHARLRSLERQHVWMPAKVVAAIYFEALRLWIKKCPSFSHPATRPNQAIPSPTPLA